MGRNVTISISDRSAGAAFHLSLSLEPGRKTWLFVNTRSFYPGRPSSSTPFQGSANDTRRRLQHDGGPEGSNTNVNIVWHCLAISGSLLTKSAIRNTSDTPARNETPLRVGSGHIPALPEYIYIDVSVCSFQAWREGRDCLWGWWPLDMSLGLLEQWWRCNHGMKVDKAPVKMQLG